MIKKKMEDPLEVKKGIFEFLYNLKWKSNPTQFKEP